MVLGLRIENGTLTVPEQAHGDSKLLQLSNSASWHILHIAEGGGGGGGE